MTVFDELRGKRQPGSVTRPTSWNASAFLYGLCALTGPHHAVEVGCGDGSSSIYLAKALREMERGKLTCYELEPDGARATMERLDVVWPGGNWKVVHGDFFQVYDGDPCSFAFIDIEPKGAYLDVWKRLEFTDVSMVAAHDSYLPPFDVEILPLELAMREAGWKVINLPWERGILLGMKS